MSNVKVVTPDFAKPLQCLFLPKRYKVLYGGRGAGRSWGAATALIIKALEHPIRVLCAREFQNSIGESVHKVIGDRISNLELDTQFVIEKAKIYSTAGAEFSFEGIKNNPQRIKSYEGIDICWVEEAESVSAESWNILIPTIRKEGSEIWVTFNPKLDTDYTFRNFVKDPTLHQVQYDRFPEPLDRPERVMENERSFVVKMTWEDNPWLPQALLEEKDHMRQQDEDMYMNIWEGNTIQLLEGAVYAKELRRATTENRITLVPYDRTVPVDTFWDLGRGDATCIWFAQRVAMQYRLLDYYTASGEDINHFIEVLQDKHYVFGNHYLPHDAKAKRLGSKRTIEEILRGAYPEKVRIVPKQSVVDGINAARIIFPTCWFDEQKCEPGLKALRHYHYRVIEGQLSQEPVHDWASDGADAFRYFALAVKGSKDTDRAGRVISRLDTKATRMLHLLNKGAASPSSQGWLKG